VDLAKYFSKDNEVHIAYGEAKDIDEKFTNQLKNSPIKAIAIPYLVRSIDLGKDYLTLMEILKIYNQGKYDLVHLNSSKAGLLGSLAARMYSANLLNTRLRLIYTAHGFVFNEPLSKFNKKLYKFSEKISTSIQNAVITVSEADKQSAIDNKITLTRKIFTIHNGIDIDNIKFYDRAEALEKLGLSKPSYAEASEGKKYFGTIASFYKTKGYPYLIEAVKILAQENSPLLEDHNFVLIGDGPEMDNIKNLAKESSVDKYFHFLGDKDEAYKYLPAFEAFILPSVKEGLPYTILEAGLAKVPIIATRVGGVGEIIKDHETGILIDPADALALAKAIKNFKEINPEILEKNYQNIKENFNLKNTLEKTQELYTKLF